MCIEACGLISHAATRWTSRRPNAALSSSARAGLTTVLDVIPTTVTVGGHLEAKGELVAETSVSFRPDTSNVVELLPLRRE